jgi:hypothetical protein
MGKEYSYYMYHVKKKGECMKKPHYRCTCGDAELYFKYDRIYKLREVEEIFDSRIASTKPYILPGLELTDETGRTFKPVLKIVLEPKGE